MSVTHSLNWVDYHSWAKCWLRLFLKLSQEKEQIARVCKSALRNLSSEGSRLQHRFLQKASWAVRTPSCPVRERAVCPAQSPHTESGGRGRPWGFPDDDDDKTLPISAMWCDWGHRVTGGLEPETQGFLGRMSSVIFRSLRPDLILLMVKSLLVEVLWLVVSIY